MANLAYQKEVTTVNKRLDPLRAAVQRLVDTSAYIDSMKSGCTPCTMESSFVIMVEQIRLTDANFAAKLWRV
jgi:hypothetical protein